MPLLALLAHGQPYFATDSTAPIVDGWSSPSISLYVAEPAPLKYKAYRIADAWIRGGRGWDCECPHCARFHDAHPPDIDRARQWWRANAQPTLEKEMLERKGPLSTWLPFLSYSPDDDLRTEAALARVGHNHWILRRLELEIRERSSDWPRLLDWVGSLVDAYRAAPGPAAWKHAVTEAFAMARAAGERLLGDEAKVDEHRDLPDGHEQKGDRDGPKHEPELRLTPKSPVPSSSHDGTLPAAHSQDNGGDGDQPLVVHRVENPPDQKHDVHEPDQVDGDGPPHPADPRVASQPPPGVVPLGLFRHSGTLPGGVRNSNAIHPGAGQRKYDVPTGGDPNVHERSMTNHPPSRALLLALLQKLRQTEGISRTWQTLQPLAAEIEGLAAAMLEWVMALATETAAFVDDQFARFHAMLADEGTSPEAAGTLARDIIDQSNPRCLVAAETLGVLSHRGAPPELLPDLGSAAISLAQACSRLQLLVAYAAHVLVNSRALAADAWLAQERASAASELASHVPAGTAVLIGQLDEVDLNALVEVQGRIETLAIDHDPAPPKFSTFVRLRVFDGGAVVQVRAHMFSLEKNGLREGACCRIRGFVRREKPWLSDNETGLDIDRVSLSSLRKQSWLDDVAYRMRPFYRLYQDEMNMFNTPGGV